jgi:hypothetical protein
MAGHMQHAAFAIQQSVAQEALSYPTSPHRRRIVDQAIRQRRAEAAAMDYGRRTRRLRSCPPDLASALELLTTLSLQRAAPKPP